ncbi:MAG: sulfotransferase domain-containing protein, partial [Caulobacteraceae bacterium]
HTPLDGLPYFENVSYVICGRDPRDAFLSMMDNMRNTSPATLAEAWGRVGAPGEVAFPTDPNTLFPLWMTQPIHGWLEDGFPIGSVFGAAKAAWPHRRLPNLFLLHYRDLTFDLEGEMRRLARFLRVTVADADWPRLVKAASFSAMRARADETAPGAHLGEWASNRAFFAHARLDAWREALSVDNQALYATLAPRRAEPELRAWLEGGRRRPLDVL